MTKFINCCCEDSVKEKTRFDYYITNVGTATRVEKATRPPEHWDEVRYLGTDSLGQDLFIAYDHDDEDHKLFYIGVKGDEF